jgi:hypothetical protein
VKLGSEVHQDIPVVLVLTPFSFPHSLALAAVFDSIECRLVGGINDDCSVLNRGKEYGYIELSSEEELAGAALVPG